MSEENIQVDLTIDKLNVSGFKWASYLLSNSISVDSAEISNIRIITSSPPIDSLDFQTKRVKKRKANDYDLIEVEHFDLNYLNIELVNNLYDSVRVSLNDMNLHANGFQLTKEDIEDRQSLFHVNWIKGSIESAEFHFDKFSHFKRNYYIQYECSRKINTFCKNMLVFLDEFVFIEK